MHSFYMPFGKYKGQSFEDVPASYLDWLLDQDWLGENLRASIEAFFSNDPEPNQRASDFNSWQSTYSYQQQRAEEARRAERQRQQQRQQQHQYQQQAYSPNPTNGLTADEKNDLKEMLSLGFRQLAKRYHPDTGGTKEAMQRLNNLVSKLRNQGMF